MARISNSDKKKNDTFENADGERRSFSTRRMEILGESRREAKYDCTILIWRVSRVIQFRTSVDRHEMSHAASPLYSLSRYEAFGIVVS